MQMQDGQHQITIARVENEKKLSGGDRGSDHIIAISGTECGRSFQFNLKGNRLEPKPFMVPPGGISDDWYVALNERERVDLMQAVLAHYREDSADKDGMKTAAIGIVENPDKSAPAKDRHLMFVSFNTNDSASHYLKSCAERNALEAGNQAMRRHMIHKCDEKNPAPFKFKEFHVMGGRNGEIPGVCPCGQCTDRMAEEMVPGGKVYIHPAINADLQKLIDYTAQSFSEVDRGTVWATNIDVLNNKRRIILSTEDAEIQRRGMEWVAERLVDYKPQARSEEAIARNNENYQNHIESVPELDVATENGVLNIEKLDAVLREELLKTLAPRLERDGIAHKKEAILEWLRTTVDTVRIVALRTDDGLYHMGKDSRTGSDKAYVNAETSTLSAAIDSLGRHGVEALYPLTFCPKDIENGVLRTLSKDGLERAYKRRTKVEGKEISVSHILLSDGSIPREKKAELAAKLSFDMNTIYPGRFAGVNSHNYGGRRGGSWTQNIPRDALLGIV